MGSPLVEPEDLGEFIDEHAVGPINCVSQGVHHPPSDPGAHGDQLVHRI